MPWVLKGTTIYKRVGGKLVKKQKAKSVANAKSAMRLLHAIEFNPGWRPTKKRSR